MTEVYFIRHGRTAWNAQDRIQGHIDEPLSPEGREALRDLRPPPPAGAALWFRSPLERARETAALLGIGDARPDARLIEMDWGAWQGETVAGLRDRLGAEMLANEAQGLDFRPPGGESPREVQDRILDWLAASAPEADRQGSAVGAVTHKGVIRAVLALAHDWDMTGRAPVKLEWLAVHVFEYTDGRLRPVAINVPLERTPVTGSLP